MAATGARAYKGAGRNNDEALSISVSFILAPSGHKAYIAIHR